MKRTSGISSKCEQISKRTNVVVSKNEQLSVVNKNEQKTAHHSMIQNNNLEKFSFLVKIFHQKCDVEFHTNKLIRQKKYCTIFET